MLLRDWRSGDREAFDALIPLVYEELHKLAARHLARERASHTLRPTDLISEVYLKMVGSAQPEWNDRVHFFAIASRGMRQILVDHATARGAAKRGGGERPLEFDDNLAANARPDELVALHHAIDKLGKFDARKADAIVMQVFGGMTQEEIALALDVHVNTVARDLRLAQAWIHTQMSAES
jgi:RNA polymerase sigma factor (TIGR02999 family)